MARTTWHPYAPDQAFGHQAALDEELVDRALAELEQHRQHPPRAGCKAEPDLHGAAYVATGMTGWIGSAAGLPVTTNIALEAAARLRSEVD
jgi:hypothetical protein